ncbi:MAG: protease HtpX [Acidiferrobacterales bacterium]|nr:protease HtpX [Acidiferrobacterales bacterium]
MAVFGVFLFILMQIFPEFAASNFLFITVCFVMGMGGALFSLFRSKSGAKRMQNMQMITSPSNQTEQWLVSTVQRQAEEAGIGMPEVGIFSDPSMNAFATGANKNDALVAVSTGLLENMSKEEAEAVMGHEIAHVANGDMVTLTLITGVVNTFVLIAARLVGGILGRGNRMGYMMGYFGAQFVFGFLATMIVSYFSRRREFRADEGGAKYSNTENMIGALERLKGGRPSALPNELAAFGINSGVKKLFSTHPPLDDRIAALRKR